MPVGHFSPRALKHAVEANRLAEDFAQILHHQTVVATALAPQSRKCLVARLVVQLMEDFPIGRSGIGARLPVVEEFRNDSDRAPILSHVLVEINVQVPKEKQENAIPLLVQVRKQTNFVFLFYICSFFLTFSF